MKTVLAFLVLALAQVCVVNADTPTFPNILYLGSGYDIIVGNPHGTSGIVGFRHPIYNLSESVQPLSGESWTIPAGTSVLNAPSCSYESTTSDVSGESSYLQSLKLSVSVEGEFIGGSFSASSDYKRVSQGAYQYHNVELHTIASCTAYSASIVAFNPPKFTIDFVNAITMLAAEPAHPFLPKQILQQYGTHVVYEVTMGAKLIKQDIFTFNAYQNMLNLGVDAKVAAKYSFGVYSGSISASSSYEYDTASKYQATRSDVKFTVIGSDPKLSSGDPDKWFLDASKNPVPNSYSLVPLVNFVTPQNFPTLDATAVNAAKDALTTAVQSWCANSGGISCDGTKDDYRPLYSGIVTNSGQDGTSVVCERGIMLSVGMSERNSGSKYSTDHPSYKIDSSLKRGYCWSTGESITCSGLCIDGFTSTDVKIAEQDGQDQIYAQCPQGYVVAACANTFQTGGYTDWAHTTPEFDTRCWCYSYGGVGTCQATCINASKAPGYIRVDASGPGKQDFYATCPDNKRLLGCGMSPNHHIHDGNFYHVAPVSDNACKCWTVDGGYCHAMCADY